MKFGIFDAAVYNPFAAEPIKYVTIYLSETLITHQRIILGIIGIEYLSISLQTPFVTPLILT